MGGTQPVSLQGPTPSSHPAERSTQGLCFQERGGNWQLSLHLFSLLDMQWVCISAPTCAEKARPLWQTYQGESDLPVARAMSLCSLKHVLTLSGDLLRQYDVLEETLHYT